METTTKEKEILYLNDDGFWSKWFAKLLFTLISLKTWGLAASLIVSTKLLMMHKAVLLEPKGSLWETGITGGQWLAFNTTIWALLFGIKEVNKITVSKDKTELEAMNLEALTKTETARIAGESLTPPNPSAILNGNVVGENPDNGLDQP